MLPKSIQQSNKFADIHILSVFCLYVCVYVAKSNHSPKRNGSFRYQSDTLRPTFKTFIIAFPGRVDTFVLAKTRRFAKYVLLMLVKMIIKGQAMQKRWCPVCFHCAVTLELFGTNAQWLQPRNEQSHDWGKGGLRPTISTKNVVLRPPFFRLHNVDFPTICVCLNLPAYPYQLHEADIMVWTMKLYLGVSASLAALFPPLS